MNNKTMKEKMFLITYAIILFVILINYQWIFSSLAFLGQLFLPFIIGTIMAFVLNVLMKMLEEKPLKKMKKYKRIVSVVLSIGIVIGFIVFLLLILIPQLKNAGNIFLQNLPKYQENLYDLGEKIGLSGKTLEILDFENSRLQEEITSLISENSKTIINISMGFASSILSVFANIFVGLVFAIYVLVDKESLVARIKKTLKVFVNNDTYEKIHGVGKLANVTFSNFIKVQVLEAIILGALCFVGMILFRLPYAATISVLVGFTALIPIFGAFIGCIFGAFLIFMVNPIKAATFIIFFLVLQQIEGNFIYPRVVGGKIGLPSIWVLVAVTIGGSIGGVFGMLLGVPVVSILYSLFRVYVNDKYKAKEKLIEKKA